MEVAYVALDVSVALVDVLDEGNVRNDVLKMDDTGNLGDYRLRERIERSDYVARLDDVADIHLNLGTVADFNLEVVSGEIDRSVLHDDASVRLCNDVAILSSRDDGTLGNLVTVVNLHIASVLNYVEDARYFHDTLSREEPVARFRRNVRSLKTVHENRILEHDAVILCLLRSRTTAVERTHRKLRTRLTD